MWCYTQTDSTSSLLGDIKIWTQFKGLCTFVDVRRPVAAVLPICILHWTSPRLSVIFTIIFHSPSNAISKTSHVPSADSSVSVSCTSNMGLVCIYADAVSFVFVCHWQLWPFELQPYQTPTQGMVSASPILHVKAVVEIPISMMGAEEENRWVCLC